MNKSLLKNTFAVLLSVASCLALASNDSLYTEAPDQIAASFERLLNHPSTSIVVAGPAPSKAEIDPLRVSVNAVLWEQPTYHLPVKYAFDSIKQKQGN